MIWIEQPSFRWVAGPEARVMTLRGYAAGEELVVSVAYDQLICLEHAREQGDFVLRLKLHAKCWRHRTVRIRWRMRSCECAFSDPLVGAAGPGRHRSRRAEPRLRLQSADRLGPRSPVGRAASDEDVAPLTQAASRLRQARAKLRDRRCVAICRRVRQKRDQHYRGPAKPGPALGRDLLDVKSMASAAYHDDSTTEDFS
jgi:hypothetical protein